MKKILSVVTTLVLLLITMTAYGLSYDPAVTDYAPVIQAQVNALKTGDRVVLEGGTFYCKSPIDLSNMPQDSTFECYGVLKFPVGVDGIKVSGRYLNIYINAITQNNNDYSYSNPYNGVGLKFENLNHSNIEIGRISGFKEGILAVGNSHGVYYNDIKFRNIRQCETAIKYTTKGNGFVNSNHMFGGSIYCYNGLVIEKGEGQTSPFNNNSFYNVGFENIQSEVCKLEFARGNSFYSPRFEGNPATMPTDGWINESTDCRGNMFIIDIAIYINKALNKQCGKESMVWGNLYDDGGRRVAYQKLNNWNGEGIYINTAGNDRWSYPNTYYLKDGELEFLGE